MNRLTKKVHNLAQRKRRVRASVHGTAQRPRLSVSVSNRHISAQLIDDDASTTIAHVTTVGATTTGTMTDKATWAGEAIAKKAKAKKIQTVVFDRNGRLYHGRVKALADAARKSGMEF